MLTRDNSSLRGDTMVEVLFAIAAFSLIAVSGLMVMNQGANISQRALEITLVREEMDAQAETLRFLNASYISAFNSGTAITSGTPAAEWASISSDAAASTATSKEASALGTCTSFGYLRKGSFVVDTHTAKFIALNASNFESAQSFSRIIYDASDDTKVNHSDGIWIEAVSSDVSGLPTAQVNADYIDFNIRACWSSPGQSTPMTLGTIVRLYEPR